MTMAMSDLPNDLLEEIVYRVPVKSISAVRSTCKTWNTLTYDQSFTKKQFGNTIETKENEFLMVLMMDYKVHLISVNLHGTQENDDNNIKSSIMHKANLTSLYDDAYYRVDNISRVVHCDNILLCIIYGMRLVVCNPYIGQTRCIKTRNAYYLYDQFALGYEKKKNNLLHNHKILVIHDKSFFQGYWSEIYNFNSDSWNMFYFTRDWELPFFHLGVSLMGNTYWFVRERYIVGPVIDFPYFLTCFYFTTERFGQRLHLPFHSRFRDTVTLSSVREEQLALLFQCADTLRIEIWVTTKINPKEVSWNKLFLEVNMTPLTGFHEFKFLARCFVMDEKKNVVVVLGKDQLKINRNLAYIIGKDGYFKQVDLGESITKYFDQLCVLLCSKFSANQASCTSDATSS